MGKHLQYLQAGTGVRWQATGGNCLRFPKLRKVRDLTRAFWVILGLFLVGSQTAWGQCQFVRYVSDPVEPSGEYTASMVVKQTWIVTNTCSSPAINWYLTPQSALKKNGSRWESYSGMNTVFTNGTHYSNRFSTYPNQYTNIPIEFRINPDGGAGTYRIYFDIYDQYGNVQSVGSGGRLYLEVTFKESSSSPPPSSGGDPDFYFTQVSASKTTNLTAGERIYADCDIRNSGGDYDGTGGRVEVDYWFSADNRLTSSDVFLSDDSFPDLPSGETTSEGDWVNLPNDFTGTEGWLFFIVNTNNVTSELDKTNNYTAVKLNFQASGGGSSDVDFYIQNPSLSVSSVQAGGSIRAECTQYFSGNSTSTLYSKVGYYLSKDKYLSSSDTFLDDDNSSLKNSDTNDPESQTLTIPSGTSAGSYYILFVADNDKAHTESNENNNVAYKAITITNGGGGGSTPTLIKPVVSYITTGVVGDYLNISYSITDADASQVNSTRTWIQNPSGTWKYWDYSTYGALTSTGNKSTSIDMSAWSSFFNASGTYKVKVETFDKTTPSTGNVTYQANSSERTFTLNFAPALVKPVVSTITVSFTAKFLNISYAITDSDATQVNSNRIFIQNPSGTWKYWDNATYGGLTTTGNKAKSIDMSLYPTFFNESGAYRVKVETYDKTTPNVGNTTYQANSSERPFALTVPTVEPVVTCTGISVSNAIWTKGANAWVNATFKVSGANTPSNSKIALSWHKSDGSYLTDLDLFTGLLSNGTSKTLSRANSPVLSEAGNYLLIAKYSANGVDNWQNLAQKAITVVDNTPTTGILGVTITPNNIGGKAYINGNWYSNGQSLSLPAGSYPVSFKNISGYNMPSSQTVTVSANASQQVTGTYTVQGGGSTTGQYNADPCEVHIRFGAMAESVLMNGNASHNLTPAELIYYSARENNINPVLLLVKLQDEQSLLTKGEGAISDYAWALLRATGYGATDGGDITKWYGFYPQLVSCTYQFNKWRNAGWTFRTSYETYTTGAGKYDNFVNVLYPVYAQKMNQVAGKNYATKPSNSGYYNDFKDVTIQHIQSFLEAYSGSLKNDLFAGNAVGNCPNTNTTPPPPTGYFKPAEGFGNPLGGFNHLNPSDPVIVYDNQMYRVTWDYHNLDGKKMGMKWQCVEYVVRYYYQVFGHYINPNKNAIDFYRNAASDGLEAFPNGGATKPQVGDLLCLGGTKHGHVAIIREVGANYVKVIHQNMGTSNHIDLKLAYNSAANTITWSGKTTQGWLRLPAGLGNGGNVDYPVMTFQNSTGVQGQEVVVPVTVQMWNDMQAAQLSIGYDANILEFVRTENFNLKDLSSSSFNSPRAGEIRMVWYEANINKISLPDDTRIFDLRFKVLGQKGDVTQITSIEQPAASVFIQNDIEIAGGVQPGIVEILSTVNISGKVLDRQGNPIPEAEVLILTDKVNPDALGFYTKDVNAGSNLTLTVAKPNASFVNGLNVADILAIKKYLLGINTFSDLEKLIADVNGDGAINVRDLLEIKKLLLGISTEFPNNVPSWKFVAKNTTNFQVEFPNIATDKTQDFTGCKVGDVALGYANPNGKVEAMRLEIPTQKAKVGEMISIPVQLNRMDLQAFQAELKLENCELVALENADMTFTETDKVVKKSSAKILWIDELGQNISTAFVLKVKVLGDGNIKIKADGFENETASTPILGQARIEVMPEKVGLEVYPNPSAEKTHLRVQLPKTKTITLQIFNATGVRVHQHSYSLESGKHQLTLPTLPKGFYVVKIPELQQARKLIRE